MVEGLLVAACERSEFRRERTGHHDVRDRQQQTLLMCQPFLGLLLLALRPVPVLTGVGAVMLRLAGLTMIDLGAERLRAAPLDVLHGPQMTGQHPVPTCRAVGGAMDAENRSALHHHRSPRRRLMAAAPRCSALAVRCVETRVVVGERCPRYTCMSRRLTPASSRWVAPEWRSVGTAACWWSPLCLRACLNAPCTRLLGMGVMAGAMWMRPRPGAGKISTGWRCVTQEWRSRSSVRRGKGTVPIFPAFTMSDVDQHASAIDIGDLQMSPLLQAEPTGVARGQAHAVAGESHAGEGGPVAIEGMWEEKLDATQGNRARAPRVPLDMLEVEEILSEFFLGDHVRGCAIVLRQLVHSPDVHLLRPCSQAPALQTLDHALAQLGHG